MVHLVPDDGVDDGPALATRVVPIDTAGSFEAFEQRMHDVEHEVLVSTVAAICQDPSILRAATEPNDRTNPTESEELHV